MLTVLSTRTPDGGPCEGTLPLDGLLRFRESGGTSHTCLECQTTHDVSELLAGFTAPPLPPLHTDLRQLRHEVRAGRGAATATATILDEIRRHQEHAAEAADAIRRVIKALAGDVADCPRLFTVVPGHAGATSWLRPRRRPLRITLWCEHPDHWHPHPPARYDTAPPRSWMAGVAPYAGLMVTTLRLALPVTAAAGAGRADDRAATEVALMDALLGSLTTPAGGAPDEDRTSLTPAQGQAVRRFRALLLEQDPARTFGDLRRVVAPSGEYLWVCPSHHRDYDPGLPTIPLPPGGAGSGDEP